jgi:hypothetical protein
MSSNSDHQLVGIGEGRLGAKREADRKAKGGRATGQTRSNVLVGEFKCCSLCRWCSVLAKRRFEGLSPQRKEGNQGCLGESPSGEEKWEVVVQVKLKDGPGMVLSVSPPLPGSAWLRNSCCIVTLGWGPENCQRPNYRHFSLVS